MNELQSLPAGFEALASFASNWIVETSAERDRLRSESTAEQRVAFYDAFKDRAVEALELLDRKPLAELNAHEQRLMKMLLAFAHVALAVESQGPDEGQHAKSRVHMRITTTPADHQARAS